MEKSSYISLLFESLLNLKEVPRWILLVAFVPKCVALKWKASWKYEPLLRDIYIPMLVV